MKKKVNGSIEKIHKYEDKLTKKIRKSSKKFGSEFKKFITKGNIIELAVAMVMGTTFNAIVKGLVEFIITPVTTFIIGSTVDLSELKWILRKAGEETEPAEAVAEISIKYGSFIQTVINFLIVALSVFVTLRIYMRAVKIVNRREEAKKKAEEAKKKAEEEQKKAEAAAEAAAIKAKEEADEEARRLFYENAREQAEILREIRDSLKKEQNDGKKEL